MRNVFANAGRDASVGRYAFGFAWGAWAALLISTILFCLARRKRRDPAVAPATGRRGWRPWRRGTISGGTYDGRRVKDDYA
jgi:hypothetical protein